MNPKNCYLKGVIYHKNDCGKPFGMLKNRETFEYNDEPYIKVSAGLNPNLAFNYAQGRLVELNPTTLIDRVNFKIEITPNYIIEEDIDETDE